MKANIKTNRLKRVGGEGGGEEEEEEAKKKRKTTECACRLNVCL